MPTDLRDMFLTMDVATGGRGGGGYSNLPLLKSGGYVHMWASLTKILVPLILIRYFMNLVPLPASPLT